MKLFPKQVRHAIEGTFAVRAGQIVDSEGDLVPFEAGDFIVRDESGLPASVMSASDVARWFEPPKPAKKPGRKPKKEAGDDKQTTVDEFVGRDEGAKARADT